MNENEDEVFLQRVENFKRDRRLKVQEKAKELCSLSLSYDQLLQLAAEQQVRREELQGTIDDLISKNQQLGKLALESSALFKSTTKELAELNDRHVELSFAQGVNTQKRSLAKSGAEAKLDNDPKQQEKEFVRECWNEWQKNPERYEGKTAFARDMLTKCDALKNQNVIVRWCGAWEKKNSTQLAE